MLTPNSVAPATEAASGLPMAVTIAVAVTALVAVGMCVWSLRRSARSNRLSARFGAITALVILVGAMAIGGSLTRPPAASADEDQAPRGSVRAPFDLELTGFQLLTI